MGYAFYCRSGITTFEQCNMTVTSVTGSVCLPDCLCRNGLIAYTGAGLSAPGDSGAPLFALSSDPAFNGAFIRGLHIGIAGTTTTGNPGQVRRASGRRAAPTTNGAVGVGPPTASGGCAAVSRPHPVCRVSGHPPST